MDRGRVRRFDDRPLPRENNYRPGERYGRSPPPPRRGRTPPGDRQFSVRGGTPYSRGPSPGRAPPRYRSRSPARPRDGPGFRPRSPPRGLGRPRSPLPPRRFSRSPPRRAPPPRRSSPPTYRPGSPPPGRDTRVSGPPRDGFERRGYGGSFRDGPSPRDDGPRYTRNSLRPRERSISPARAVAAQVSKDPSTDSSRVASPAIHPDRMRLVSPAPYVTRSDDHPPRRSSPYRPRERSPLPLRRGPSPLPVRSPVHDRPPYRERLPPRASPLPRRASPPRRPASPPPQRPNYYNRSPSPGGRSSFRERPPRSPPRDLPDRGISHDEPPSWTDRAPPSGPRHREDEPRAPPTGPRGLQEDMPMRDAPSGPAASSGPAAASTFSRPYGLGPPRGRGGPPYGRGRGDLHGPPSGYGRGRGWDGPPPRRGGFDAGQRGLDNGPPSGPRGSFAESGPPGRSGPDRPPFRSNNSTSSTYPRTQRFHQYLGNMPQVIEGGKKLPSGLNSADERRLEQLEAEKERLYKDIDEKQRKKRATEREYSRAQRDVEIARLRSELAEEQLEKIVGGSSMADATAY